MKTIHPFKTGLFRFLFLLNFICATFAFADENTSATETSEQAYEWPYTFKSANGTTFSIYQPQYSDWDGFRLNASSAVSVQPDNSETQTFGMVSLAIQTTTDAKTNRVQFNTIHIKSSSFPAAENSGEWVGQLKSELPKALSGVDLTELKNALDISDAASKTDLASLNNDPPKIIVSTRPAALIPIQGDPQWRAIDGTSLQRAINTQALLLRDGNRYLLHIWDGYVQANRLEGPWTVASSLPENIAQIEEQLSDAKQVDLLREDDAVNDEEAPSLKTDFIPDFYLSTTPTELVVLDGEPQWATVPDTSILYVINTESSIFKEIETQNTYILISGRWFKARTLYSPWTYVPADKLPHEFSKIPDNGPLENVKASISGTKQAQEAVINNNIPQVSKIDRSSTKMENTPVYENGQPELQKIQNTNLLYAINASVPVFTTDNNVWYACDNAIWFTANSPYGPWVVATVIPSSIYSIPVNSPVHYVSYVRIYRYDPYYCWIGYTPGYYGTIVSPEGVVIYGSGYSYTPYIGSTVYVAYPVSYGYSTNLCWAPRRGWYFGFSIGFVSSRGYWRCPPPPPPCWGPYRHYYYGRSYDPRLRVNIWNQSRWQYNHAPRFDYARAPRHDFRYNNMPARRFESRFNSQTAQRWNVRETPSGTRIYNIDRNYDNQRNHNPSRVTTIYDRQNGTVIRTVENHSRPTNTTTPDNSRIRLPRPDSRIDRVPQNPDNTPRNNQGSQVRPNRPDPNNTPNATATSPDAGAGRTNNTPQDIRQRPDRTPDNTSSGNDRPGRPDRTWNRTNTDQPQQPRINREDRQRPQNNRPASSETAQPQINRNPERPRQDIDRRPSSPQQTPQPSPAPVQQRQYQPAPAPTPASPDAQSSSGDSRRSRRR